LAFLKFPNPYPFTLQARDQTEFTGDFDTTWPLFRSNPDQPFGNLRPVFSTLDIKQTSQALLPSSYQRKPQIPLVQSPNND
jgi:hypothetical protein